jgi:predicted RNase H-like nuclease
MELNPYHSAAGGVGRTGTSALRDEFRESDGCWPTAVSKHVIGIDGCRAGWLICRMNIATVEINLVAVVRQLREVLDSENSATHIAIDIPIGLPEAGRSRKADREARKLLTSARASSVFPAPPRDF